MPETPPPQSQRPRGLWVFLLILSGALLLMMLVARDWVAEKPVPWSTFIAEVRAGEVQGVQTFPEHLLVEVARTTPDKPNTYKVYWNGDRKANSEELERAIAVGEETKKNGFKIKRQGSPPPSMFESMLPGLLLIGLLVLVFWFLVIRRMGQGGGVLSFGKSRAQLIAKGKTGKTFKDVAGIDEAKEEVEELVAFLKNPKKFQKLGGRIPRGVLLVGPPGTGKTLLAKAIAGEADVPFYSISGSDFVEMFVGVGASRVRDLFNQAKDSSPCIIFIDEIDAVGRRRGQGMSTGGHDEREQTLNAILVEMDGFSSTDKVIVIAATNRVDVLDPALLRPGRFDRHIHVSLPDIAGREQILQVHAAKVKMAKGVELSLIARGTPGFSGADLESMINEAALHAARHEKEAVAQSDLEYARDRVAFGREKKSGSRAMPERERIITAYHEAGHALLQTKVAEADSLHKVTIIPRGRALGATMHLPNEDRHTHSMKKLVGDIAVLFGGRIAEELFCGDITTGASNDIDRATAIARHMVYEWGMSEKMGPMKYTEEQAGFGGEESVVAVSAQTRRELDEEVRRIIDRQYAHAEEIIRDNKDALERIAKALLEHETLDAAQVKTLIEGGELPPRQPTLRIASVESAAPKADAAPAPGAALEMKPNLA
jgi:cell division protease FtsH